MDIPGKNSKGFFENPKIFKHTESDY